MCAEQFADTAAARALVGADLGAEDYFRSGPARGKEGAVSKYEMYYDFSEPLKQIPSIACSPCAGAERKEFLRLQIEAPEDEFLVAWRNCWCRGFFVSRV